MQNARILIVEDERVGAMALRSQLERFGYGVPEPVVSGEQAIRSVEADRPDLVLMDVGLSGSLDGIDTARAIRDRYDVPVIFLTGQHDHVFIDRAKQVEPAAYLLKPSSEDELYATIELALHAHKRRQAAQHLSMRYDRILAGMIDGVICTNTAGEIVFANPAAEEMFEYRKDDLLGMPMAVLVPLLRVVKSDMSGSSVLEVMGQRNGLIEFPMEMRISAIRLEDHDLSVYVMRDIIERKRGELALKQVNGRYDHLLQRVPAVIYCLDPVGGDAGISRLSYVSPNITKWLGYPEYQCLLEADWWVDNIHPKDRQDVLARRSSFIYQQGAHQFDLFSQDYLDMEYRFRLAGGSYHWVRDTLSVIHGDAGNVVEMIGSWVVENKQIEQAFHENEQKFRELVENIQEVLWMSSADWKKIFYVSPAFDDIWGFSRNRVYENPALFFRGMQQDPASSAPMPFIQSEGTHGDLCAEFKIVRPDLTARWIRCRCFPVLNDAGEIYRYTGIAEDFTAQKLAGIELNESRDQLREFSRHLLTVRDEEKATIAQEVHDELGSTMTALKMDTYWLSSHLPEKDHALHKKASSMLKLIESAISSTRRICTQLRPTILNDLGLAETMRWQARDFESHFNIPCKLNAPHDDLDISPEISLALFRILQEALTNVARHAHAKQVEVDLLKHGVNVLLVIKDDGIGLCPDRVDSGMSHGISGMAERASKLGGEVKIKGGDGQGTLIVARIPLCGELMEAS